MEVNDSIEKSERFQHTDSCLSLCLICGSEKCKRISDDGGGGGVSSGGINDSLISKQLNVIYILKQLLQVPSSKLQQYLKKCGNPQSWISLCDNCTILTGQATECHYQIVKIQKLEKSFQKQIIDKVRSSSLASSSLVKLIKPKSNKEQFTIWRDTRKFVENHNYGDIWEDPLLQTNQSSKIPEPPDHQLPPPPPEPSPIKLFTPVEPSSAPQVKIEAHPDDIHIFPFPTSPFSSGDYNDDWLPSPPSPPPFEESEPLVCIKKDIEIPPTITSTSSSSAPPPVKRGRGRPRKIKTENDTATPNPAPPSTKSSTSTNATENSSDIPTTVTTFSKRGRPRKSIPKVIIDDSDNDTGDEWVPSPTEQEPESEPEEDDKDKHRGTPSNTGSPLPKQCPHCPSKFKHTAVLFNHMTETHDIHQFPCGLPGCSAKLKNAKQYLRHRRIRHKPGSSVDNQEEDNLEGDISSSTGTPQEKSCPECSSTFTTTTALFTHMTEAHDIHQFPCGLPDCPAKLKNVKQYLRHRRIVHKPGGLSGYRDQSPLKSRQLRRLSRTQKKILKKQLKLLPPQPQDTTPTTCHLCGETLPLCDLNAHLYQHKDTELALAAQDGATSTNGTFKCPVIGCKIEYNTKKGYQKHLDDKHGGSAENPIRQFSCSYCPRQFCHRRKWREHEETHRNANSKPYSCEYCGKRFTISKYRDHHVRYSHTNKRTKFSGAEDTDARIKEIFQCTIPNCTAVYPFYSHVFHHIQRDHQIVKVPCLVTGCLRSFETLKQFQKHKARHKTIKNDKHFYEEQKYHKCIYCDEQFMYPATLMKHLKEGHGMERMPCLEVGCLRTFGTVKQFQKHKTYCQFRVRGGESEGASSTLSIKKKKEKGPRVLCEICGASYADKESLRSHVAHVHEGKKRTSYGKGTTCHLCGAWVSQGHLKVHLRKKHKDLKEYQKETWKCKVVGCRVEYVRKDMYDRHMEERHGGKEGWRKPFSCEFCGKGFCHRRKQRQHELIHRNKGNPSFVCGDCGKGFITGRYLQYHRKYTHEGMKRGMKGRRGGGGGEFGEVKNEGEGELVVGEVISGLV